MDLAISVVFRAKTVKLMDTLSMVSPHSQPQTMKLTPPIMIQIPPTMIPTQQITKQITQIIPSLSLTTLSLWLR